MPEILMNTSPLVALDNIGRLGVLIRAQQRGIIDSLAAELTGLKVVGFRLSPAMDTEAMRLTGSGV